MFLIHYHNGIQIMRDDPSPAGISLSSGSYSWAEACPCCLDKGECPWCGAHLKGDTTNLVDRNPLRCPNDCGWTLQYALDHACDPVEIDY